VTQRVSDEAKETFKKFVQTSIDKALQQAIEESKKQAEEVFFLLFIFFEILSFQNKIK